MPINHVQIQREREREIEIQILFEKIEDAKKRSLIDEVINYQKTIFDLWQDYQKELAQNYDYNNIELDYLKEYQSLWQKNQDNLDRLIENIEETITKLKNESNLFNLYGKLSNEIRELDLLLQRAKNFKTIDFYLFSNKEEQAEKKRLK